MQMHKMSTQENKENAIMNHYNEHGKTEHVQNVTCTEEEMMTQMSGKSMKMI